MKLLLDTHALLRWLNDDERLGRKARDLIEDPDNDVLVSVVSLWEIVVKVRIGKLRADVKAVAGAIDRGGFIPLALRPAHLLTLSGLLSQTEHRDPFDHLLVAQAITEDAVMLSDDGRVGFYDVKSLTCSDRPRR